MNTSKKELFLLALYITFMVLVNTIGSKITTICNVRISVGIFFMPVLFLITDIVGEVKGQKRATLFVQLAEMMLVILFAMTFLCVKLRPNETWGMQEQYTAIFGSSMRMTVASILSFIISQGVDTTIFMFLAFYHINAKYTAAFVFSLVLPYWIFKIILALLDTPFCYLGVKWLRKGSSLSDEVSVS